MLPETLQLPFWTTLNVTGRPELAVATAVTWAPTNWLGIAVKAIVWLCEAPETIYRLSGALMLV